MVLFRGVAWVFDMNMVPEGIPRKLEPMHIVERVIKTAMFRQRLEFGGVRGDRFPCLARSGIEAEALYSER